MTPAEPSTAAERVAPQSPLAPELTGQMPFAGEGPAPLPGAPSVPGVGERHLRLVPRRTRRRWFSGRFLLYAFVAGVAAVAFGLVALHVLIAEVQFRLDGLQQKAAVYQGRYEKLRLQVAEDEAPARIIRVATESGLQQPASVTYLPAPRTGSATSGQGATSSGTGRSGTASPGTTRSGATGSGTGSSAPPSSVPSRSGGSDVVPAPAGEGNWPAVKPLLGTTP